jgi:hypothetical protein
MKSRITRRDTTARRRSEFRLIVSVVALAILAGNGCRVAQETAALPGQMVTAVVPGMKSTQPDRSWVRKRSVVVAVVARTALYAVGVAGALLLEKAFEARHEYGGFGRALLNVFHHRDIYHLWANTICLACALLEFNALSVVRRHLGDQRLIRLYFSPASGEFVS